MTHPMKTLRIDSGVKNEIQESYLLTDRIIEELQANEKSIEITVRDLNEH